MILCATRGGEGSRALISAAIEEAKLLDKELIFLFVVNTEAFAVDNSTIDQYMNEELHWLGGVVLRLMQLRARESNVNADIQILEGTVRDSIIEFARGRVVERLFVGAPFGITTDVFGDDEIEKFALRVEDETAVPVKIIHAPSVSKKSANKTTFS